MSKGKLVENALKAAYHILIVILSRPKIDKIPQATDNSLKRQLEEASAKGKELEQRLRNERERNDKLQAERSKMTIWIVALAAIAIAAGTWAIIHWAF